jgi:5'-3' exonuclease
MDFAAKLRQFSETHTNVEPISRDSKVLLVDGLNQFMRMFASTPTMNEDGVHMGGYTGFLRGIGMAIRQFKPSRCVIVFDGKGGSAKRRAIFKDYKENRRSMTKLNRTYDFNTLDDEVDSRKYQLIKLVESLTHLPVTVIAIDNIEADDALAYLANLTAERGGEAIIMSNDRDFLQLVNAQITVYNPIKKKVYTVESVVEEYGIHPNNFVIYRTIDGDKSDNIPGVHGVGPAKLIKYFPELANAEPIAWEHIFAVAEGNDSKACKDILNNKDLLERNTSLMRLDEQHMSGAIRLKVLSQFDAPINGLNKLALTQSLLRDRLLASFPNIDEWMTTTFAPLSRFSGKA